EALRQPRQAHRRHPRSREPQQGRRLQGSPREVPLAASPRPRGRCSEAQEERELKRARRATSHSAKVGRSLPEIGPFAFERAPPLSTLAVDLKASARTARPWKRTKIGRASCREGVE